MGGTARLRGAAPSEVRQRLRGIIRDRSLLTDGAFTLASGRQSAVFFDMKRTMFDPEGASLIAEIVLDHIGERGIEAIGGLAMGAVPIVAVVCAKSFEQGRPIQGFFVRKETKDHGTQKLIDGNLSQGARVAILEDVTTTGGSALKAAEAVHAVGGHVALVVSIVDRLEGAADAFRSHNLAFEAIFTRDDFL